MDYYRLEDGTLAPTQDAARKSGQKWEPHTVPTDKQGLMDYLNFFASSYKSTAGAQKPTASDDSGSGGAGDTAPPPPTAPDGPQNGRDMRVGKVLARIDAPEGVDVDRIGEVILKSSGYVLASFAEAVAMRYAALAKSGR